MTTSSFAIPVDDLALARARKGNRDAQAYLYRSFATPVYSLAYRICASKADAEDITQDTFIELFAKLHQFRGDSPFWGWLRRIAVNKTLMKLRQRKQLAEQAEATEHSEAAEAELNETTGEVPELVQRDLEYLLGHLSETARLVVWLYDIEGYTHQEIGAMMQKTSSFSKSQRSRAYARLRDLLCKSNQNTTTLISQRC